MDGIKQALLDAQNEKKFSADDLLLEIKPLIDEYFIGNFEIDGNSLTLKFLNGQKFCLSITEC